ncbi:MAG: DNA recombination protein RmuC [Solirubrobacterales bacterium]|nr:DNA recombination protein RmuC [Solirubrobacterales bacterium]
MIFIGIVTGLLIGGLGTFLLLSRRSRQIEIENTSLNGKLVRSEDHLLAREDAHQAELAHRDEMLRTAAENHQREIARLQADEERMREQMTAISGEVLERTSKQLDDRINERQKLERERAKNELDQRTTAIKSSVEPVAEKLGEMQKTVSELEKERAKAHTELGEQIGFLKGGVQDLARRAGGLTEALKKPSGRGSWGEIQLQNVLEMAGMVEHCDFEQQVTVEDDGSRLRPDVTVNMPGERIVVVDAKVPMEAFLQAQEATDDETRDAFLAQHAQQVRSHVSQLRKKEYQAQFDRSPELVVMFVPSEGIYHSALAQDSSLLEYGLTEKVLIATPTTLIGILQAINYGWGQDRIARSAEEIANAGRELHKRILTFTEHFAKMGRQLGSATGSYNAAVGSFERMVVPQLRRIEDAGAKSAKELAVPESIDVTPAELNADISLPDPGDSGDLAAGEIEALPETASPQQ